MGLREKAVEEFTEELLHMTYREISLALARYQLPMNNIFRSNVFINAFRVSSQLKVRPLSSHRQNFDQTRLFAASSSEAQQPLDLKPGPQSEVPTETRQVSKRIGDLVDQIASLSILEVSDLNYELRKRLNLPEFSAMSAGMIMGSVAQRQDDAKASADSDAVESAASQKTSFIVRLKSFDETKKVALIKEIRNVIPGLNLVQAKKFVESAPAVVKQDIGKTEADDLKALLEKAGGSCEID